MKTLVAPLCALALLSACGQGASAPELLPAATAAGLAEDAGRAERAQAARQRARAFKQALLPLFAGAYRGSCTLHPSRADTPALTVAADGRASAPGIEHDVLQDDADLYYSRRLRGGKGSAVRVGARSRDPVWSLTLNSGAGRAVLDHEGASVECGGGARLASLAHGSVHAAVGRFFVSPPRSLDCVVALKESRRLVYQAGAAEMRIGAQVFSFDKGIAVEQAGVSASGTAYSYAIEYEGKARVTVNVNAMGELGDLFAIAPDGTFYQCAGATAQAGPG